MMVRAAAFLIVAAFLTAARAVAAPEVTASGGATTIVQSDASAPLLNVTIAVRAGLDRETLRENGIAALTAETILRTPVDGIPLEEAAAAHGGSVHFFVDAADVRFAVEALPQDAATVLDLARRAIASPNFGLATVNDARKRVLDRIAENDGAALQVGLDMLDASTAPSANAGLPSWGIPGAVAQMTADDVKGFYGRYYVRDGTFVSAVGRTDAVPAASIDALSAALPAGTSSPVVTKLAQLSGTSHQFVAHRDIVAPWLMAQYPAPSVESKDFGPMLVLAAFLQRTLSDVAEVPNIVSPTFASNAVGTLYQYDRDPPHLTLYVNGGIPNPTRVFASALSVAGILSATKLQGSIDQFKATAAGDFVTSVSTLESRAWLAIVFDRNARSADYATRTLQAIAATTPADLQRVARTYLGDPQIALVLPRDGS